MTRLIHVRRDSFNRELQRVAACCSALQRVAACISVLQRVAVRVAPRSADNTKITLKSA